MRDLVDTCTPLKASTFCDCVSIEVDVDHVLALLHGLVLRRLEHLVEGQATLVAAAHHVDVSIADPVGVATRRQTRLDHAHQMLLLVHRFPDVWH